MTQTVLILGAGGRCGRHAAEAFTAAGWTVRTFDRHTDNMKTAALGCDVIVNGMNPPDYHDWDTIVPQITAEVIDAARASGATVLLPGNVYHFGSTGGVWSEKTSPNPMSRKGALRFEMERQYATSGVQTIVLRAGNFIDPELRGCVMGALYLRRFKAGKIGLPGPATTRQAMCYLPDWARAAVILAEMRGQLAPFEDIPFPGHTLTGHDIKRGMEMATGRRLKFEGFPWWLFRLASPVWELAREMLEMRYLWETDHSLSAEKFDALCPDFAATPIDDIWKRIGKTATSA